MRNNILSRRFNQIEKILKQEHYKKFKAGKRIKLYDKESKRLVNCLFDIGLQTSGVTMVVAPNGRALSISDIDPVLYIEIRFYRTIKETKQKLKKLQESVFHLSKMYDEEKEAIKGLIENLPK